VLDEKLLEILACPKCKQRVVPNTEHTFLDCRECNLRYRVEDGIPIMLVDEALPLDGGK